MTRWVFALLAVVAASGCTDRACFRWNKDKGPCPTPVEAREHFGKCNDIQTIDSDASRVGKKLCCYDVTKTNDLACGPRGPDGPGEPHPTPRSDFSETSGGF